MPLKPILALAIGVALGVLAMRPGPPSPAPAPLTSETATHETKRVAIEDPVDRPSVGLPRPNAAALPGRDSRAARRQAVSRTLRELAKKPPTAKPEPDDGATQAAVLDGIRAGLSSLQPGEPE